MLRRKLTRCSMCSRRGRVDARATRNILGQFSKVGSFVLDSRRRVGRSRYSTTRLMLPSRGLLLPLEQCTSDNRAQVSNGHKSYFSGNHGQSAAWMRFGLPVVGSGLCKTHKHVTDWRIVNLVNLGHVLLPRPLITSLAKTYKIGSHLQFFRVFPEGFGTPLMQQNSKLRTFSIFCKFSPVWHHNTITTGGLSTGYL